MADFYPPSETPAVELPQPESPQQPESLPTPPDYATKRKNFLTKFAALDSEAKLDEQSLGDILISEGKADEFTAYVGKLNPKFTMSGQQLAEALGYKKKVDSPPAGTASGTSASAALPTGDKAFVSIAPELGKAETPPREAGLRLDGDTIHIPHSGQVEAPGDDYLAAGLPLPSGEELRAKEEARTRAKAEAQDDGFWASLGKSLYNGLDPKRIGGNLVDYFGDAMEMLGRSPNISAGAAGAIPREVAVPDPSAPLLSDKLTDRLAANWLLQAREGDLPLSDAAQQSVLSNPSLASAGAMLGSGISSIVPVAAASVIGGPLAGAGVGGALGISATKDAAREAGVSDKEAAVTATLLAPVQAALEAVGVHDAGVSKLAVRATLREALASGGGQLTQQALTAAAKKVLPELGRRAAAGASHEALTEFLQGEAEGGTKLLADQLRGNDEAAPGAGRYGITPFEALGTSPLEQALVGGVLGGGLGTTHGPHGSTPPGEVYPQTPLAGTKAIPADLSAANLRGRTVLIRDEQGNVGLRQVHNVLDKAEGRKLILRNAEGKLSSYPAGDVFLHDATARPSGPAGNRITQAIANLLPTPSGLQALAQATLLPSPTQPTTSNRVLATDPGPTVAPAQRQVNRQAPAGEPTQVTTPNAGPTLGQLVPNEQPVHLTFKGEPVQALRNQEGDIELHHVGGQVSVLDKGDQFEKPAADFSLALPKTRVKVGDTFTVGGGDFTSEHKIEDVLRDKAGQITAVMVAGQNGPRIIEDATPEGKAALVELNSREQTSVSQSHSEFPPPTERAPAAITTEQRNFAHTTPDASASAAAHPAASAALSNEQRQLGAAIVYASTKGAATGFGRSLAEVEALATEVRAGKVDEKELARRLPGLPLNTLIEAKKALRAGTLADMLSAAAATKRTQVPDVRTAETVGKARQRVEQELAEAKTELAHPDFGIKLQRPTGLAALADPTPRRVLLSPESLARKRTVQQERIATLEQQAGQLREEEQRLAGTAGVPAALTQAQRTQPTKLTASNPVAQPQGPAQPATTNPQPAGASEHVTPTAKRQQALEKIRQRRGQQPASPAVVGEYTQAYQLRDGEPESIREIGHQALEAAEKVRRRAGEQLLPGDGSTKRGSNPVPASASPAPQGYRGKAEVSQSGISAEMRQKGSASFVGRIVRSIADIAELAQVMRDPRWETFKYYFVKDLPDGSQEIVGERTLSARMPGTAPAFPNQGSRPGQSAPQWLASEMQAAGADGYYAQHNHPSGLVSPSPADLEYTKFIAGQVPSFRGHIIINHGKYTVLSMRDGELQTMANIPIEARHQAMQDLFRGRGMGWPADPLTQPSKPGNLLGLTIRSADDVVGVAKSLENGAGWVTLIGRGADGRVQAVGHLPLATLLVAIRGEGGRSRGEAAIRSFARETGSPHVILAGLPKPKSPSKGGYLKSPSPAFLDLLQYDLVELIHKGALLDVVQEDGKSLSTKVSKRARDWAGRSWIGPTPSPRVWENAADYGISEDDLADFHAVLDSYLEEGTSSRKKLAERFREDVGSAAESGLGDEQLRGLIKQRQQAAGLVPKTKPGKATKERRHATRYDEATRRSFTEDEARYTPVKQIENAETARAYVRQVGLENAYAVALDKPEGFSGAAHVEVQEAVAREYRRLSDEARKTGNQAEADEFWQRSKDVRAAKVSALTEAGQTIAQVQGFIADDPDAVLDLAIRETEKQRKPLLKKAEKAAVKVATIATRERRAAMEGTLQSEAVRRVRERVVAGEPATAATKPAAEPKGYGATNKYFTKATALAARAALRKLGLSTVIPPELVHFVGYHIEALARAGGKHSFAEVSKRVVRELGDKVRPLLPEAYERARKVYVRNGGENAGFDTAEQIAQAIAPAAVQAGIKKLDTTLNRIAREQAEGVNMKGRTLAERFTTEAGLDPAQARVYAEAVKAEFQRQVAAQKTHLRNKLLTFSTRVLLGKNAATAVDKLLATLNLATDPASAGELLKKQLNLPDITPVKADEFVRLAEAVRNAKPGNERSDRVQDLMKALGKLEHVNWFDVTQAMWYANVLSGPLTHAVNITSNAKEAIAENLISTLHTWAETGSLRAATGPTRGAYQAQRRAFAEAAKIIATGYTGSQSERFGHNNILENKQFKGAAAPLNGLKYVGRALVGEDAYFNFTLRGMRLQEVALKTAYREVRQDARLTGEKLRSGELYQRAYQSALGKLYGLPTLRAASESQADAESLTGPARTRRIGQLVTEAVSAQQRKWAAIAEREGLTGVAKQQRMGELQEQAQPAELVADAKKFAEAHTFNGGYEGRLGAMGALIAQLGEIPVGQSKPFKLLAPFSRILTAVQNRRLEWIGLGFVRAIKGGTGPKDYQGGRFYREYSPEEREKAFLRSTLGTVSALALYSLAKAGYLTITGTSFGDKDKEQESPNSSIKWGNGLFTSYKGDTMEIILAAIGNTLEWERKQEKAGKATDPAKRLAVITGLTTMYTLGMGPMKGVDDFNEAVVGMSRNPDKGINYVTRFGANTAKGLIPFSAGVQQTLRGLGIAADQNQKETSTEPAWQAAYNSLVVDVPWVRDGLEDAIDILGEPMKATSNRLWGWQPDRSATDQAALDFLAEHDLLPARSRITDDNLAGYDGKTGKLRPMTQAEFKAFQIARGQEFGRLLREAMRKPSDNPTLTPRQRALVAQFDAEGNKALPDLPLKEARKLVSDLHRQAVEVGKAAVFGNDLVPSPAK